MFPKCPICSPKVRKGMGRLHAIVVRVTITPGRGPCGWDMMIQAGIAIQELDLGYW
jgi:hypothetical protein